MASKLVWAPVAPKKQYGVGAPPASAVAGVGPGHPLVQMLKNPTPAPAPAPPAPVDYAAQAAANPNLWQDSTYNLTSANLQHQQQAGHDALNVKDQRAKDDTDKNVGLLNDSRGKAKTQTTQTANKSGLFYSGALGKQLGDVDNDYNGRVNDVNTALARTIQDDASQGSALDAAYDQGMQTAAQQAVDRWVGAAQAAQPAPAPNDPLIAALAGWNVGSKNARKAR